MKVQASLARPIHGVSQLPQEEQTDGQCLESVNCTASVAKALERRPGSKHVGLAAQVADNAFYHYYKRDGDEQYIITIEDTASPVKITSPDGTVHTVNTSAAAVTYLRYGTGDPSAYLSALTSGDTTFIANNNKTVTESSSTTAVSPYDAVYLREVVTGGVYKLSINFLAISYTALVGDTVEDVLQGLAALVTGLAAAFVYVGEGFIVYTAGGINSVNGPNIDDFFLVQKSAVSLSDLPKNAPETSSCTISGVDAEDVYITASGETVGYAYNIVTPSVKLNIKSWAYGPKPSERYKIEAASMPITIVRSSVSGGVAVFTVGAATWADRLVGSKSSSRDPSFYGKKIQAIGMYSGRLYFITDGDRVTASDSSNLFNFFRTSSVSLLDTDPIDLYPNTNTIANVRQVIDMADSTLLLGPEAQLAMASEGAATGQTTNIFPVSQNEMDVHLKPATISDRVYYTVSKDSYVELWEYKNDPQYKKKIATNVTEQVPEYLPGRAKYITGSALAQSIAVLTDDGTIGLFNVAYTGSQPKQAAWSKITLQDGCEVLWMKFIDGRLYLITRRESSDLVLEYIPFDDPTDTYLSFSSRMDAKRLVTATKQSDDTWTAPADALNNFSEDDLVLVKAEDCEPYEAGIAADFTYDSVTGFVFPIDLNTEAAATETCKLWMGLKYSSRYVPTMPFVRDRKGIAITVDKLRMNRFYMNYAETGYIEIEIWSKGRLKRTIVYEGRIMGDPLNVVGFAVGIDGQYSFGVKQNVKTTKVVFTTDSHLPFRLNSLEWTGRFTQKGARL